MLHLTSSSKIMRFRDYALVADRQAFTFSFESTFNAPVAGSVHVAWVEAIGDLTIVPRHLVLNALAFTEESINGFNLNFQRCKNLVVKVHCESVCVLVLVFEVSA